VSSDPVEDTAEHRIKQWLRRRSFLLPPIAAEEAFYGVAGRIAKKAAAKSEVDAIGVLVQFLCGFGNKVGRGVNNRTAAGF
jgi:hypothetical protein